MEVKSFLLLPTCSDFAEHFSSFFHMGVKQRRPAKGAHKMLLVRNNIFIAYKLNLRMISTHYGHGGKEDEKKLKLCVEVSERPN